MGTLDRSSIAQFFGDCRYNVERYRTGLGISSYLGGLFTSIRRTTCDRCAAWRASLLRRSTHRRSVYRTFGHVGCIDDRIKMQSPFSILPPPSAITAGPGFGEQSVRSWACGSSISFSLVLVHQVVTQGFFSPAPPSRSLTVDRAFDFKLRTCTVQIVIPAHKSSSLSPNTVCGPLAQAHLSCLQMPDCPHPRPSSLMIRPSRRA